MVHCFLPVRPEEVFHEVRNSCPKCGELYSDTYKTCPFCEEAEAGAEGRQLKHRSGGRRVAKKKEPSAVGPVMILAAILLAVILIYLCFGDRIGAMLGGTDVPASSSGGVSPLLPVSPEEDLLNPDVTAPVVGDDEEDGSSSAAGNTGDLTLKDVENLPQTLVLSNPDFTLFKKGETTTLSVTGGEGPYTWFSSDEKVVTVSEAGVVTAVGDGSATLDRLQRHGQRHRHGLCPRCWRRLRQHLYHDRVPPPPVPQC